MIVDQHNQSNHNHQSKKKGQHHHDPMRNQKHATWWKRGKTRLTKMRYLHLTGLERGASFLNQSQSEIKQN